MFASFYLQFLPTAHVDDMTLVLLTFSRTKLQDCVDQRGDHLNTHTHHGLPQTSMARP